MSEKLLRWAFFSLCVAHVAMVWAIETIGAKNVWIAISGQTAAAWVQSVGSIAALAIAVWLPERHKRLDRARTNINTLRRVAEAISPSAYMLNVWHDKMPDPLPLAVFPPLAGEDIKLRIRNALDLADLPQHLWLSLESVRVALDDWGAAYAHAQPQQDIETAKINFAIRSTLWRDAFNLALERLYDQMRTWASEVGETVPEISNPFHV